MKITSVKGTNDYLPNEVEIRDYLQNEILKVYDIVDSKHSVKVRCDYAVSNSGTVIYNKKLKIYKSYNQFNDLLGMLQQHIS